MYEGRLLQIIYKKKKIHSNDNKFLYQFILILCIIYDYLEIKYLLIPDTKKYTSIILFQNNI